ncbi:30S ribosomal protein S6 [Candidatus Daviesbacteria bacterium]|nr:30S ribosomal protein S6 [Candidatus Daviesbacteria bacterium]
MSSYYLTLVLKPDLNDEARQKLLENVKAKATGDGGKLVKEDLWGVRELAYPIQKQTKGYYVHFELEGEPKTVKDLDKSLKVEEDIIRYLLVRK